MKAKAKAGSKFGVRSIKQLPPKLRTNPQARAAVAANKALDDARFVLEREERALKTREERVKEARATVKAAEEALEEAVAALEKK